MCPCVVLRYIPLPACNLRESVRSLKTFCVVIGKCRSGKEEMNGNLNEAK